MQVSCWKCGEGIPLPRGARVGTRDTCTRCDADLHCCLNCCFYDPAKHNQCAEPQAEWVRIKDAANYCDYFAPSARTGAAGRPAPVVEDARKKFDSLFKK